jgi:hypothetical protein
MRTIQFRDSATQPTLVFLSSGYQYGESATFWTDVYRATRALSETRLTASIDASPWPRYYSLLNIFAVFEPSIESGASTAVGPGFDCGSAATYAPGDSDASSRACVARPKVTNLGCAYGTPQPRLLSCDHAKTMTLASRAPTADVVIVLVNDARYGGTGSDGLAVVSNGADMGFLLIHELNHAIGGLGDEYSYGFSEVNPSQYALPNCAEAQTVMPWKAWIDKGKADFEPKAGCTFDNLFRPTDAGCLMRSKATQMCAVCRERATQAITTKKFTLPKQGSRARIGLASPRCPPDGFDLILTSDQTATLTINHLFATFNENVSVVWTVPQAAAPANRIVGLPSILIRGSDMPLGTSTVVVTVTDSTDFMTKANLLNDTATFRVRRLGDGLPNANCTTLVCPSTTGSQTYCGVCTKTEGCLPTYSESPREYTSDPRISMDQATSAIELLTILIVLGGIAVVLFVVIVIAKRRTSNPKEVLIMGGLEEGLGVVAMVAACLAYLSSCAVIAVLFVYFKRVPVFGIDAFVALFVFSAVVYLLCAITFCSVVARGFWPMMISGVFEGIIAVGVFVIAAFALYVTINSDSSNMIERYRGMWLDNVRDHPTRICELQNFLTCSGFEQACIPVPSSYCPRDCEYQNRNANPCLGEWQNFVHDTLRPIAIVTIIYCFLLLFAAAFCVMFAVAVERLRGVARGRRSYRRDPRAPVCPITDEELRSLEQEFGKADHDKTGLLEGKETLKFMRAVFGEEYTTADEQAVIAAATNPDGSERGLSLDEILDIFFPARTMRPDPRLLTDDEALEAESTSDLVRRQFRKMEAFMEASGALSPERMLYLHESYIRALGDDDATDFLEVVRKAAAEHAKTVEADMCRGLTYNDLEGLRCAWVTLHESIAGTLTDDEIGRLYRLTHDQGSFVSQEHYARWKRTLDIRGKGVGWPEFCYPFAQRNLLRNARQRLADSGHTLEILSGQPKLLSRDDVAAEYGSAYVETIFLPFEKVVPVERAVVATMTIPKLRSGTGTGNGGSTNGSSAAAPSVAASSRPGTAASSRPGLSPARKRQLNFGLTPTSED